MKTFAFATAAALAAATFAHAQNPMVGGAEMFADKTIAENASAAPNLTTLVAAAQQAGLVDTLASDGPFTIFAPTDAAFGKLSQDSVNQLMMDENRQQLAQILTCHVVAAEAFAADIGKMIANDGGAHPVATVGGCTLTAYMDGDKIMLRDENGREATVTIANGDQSNGVVHVIDRVLLPAGQAG